MGLKNIWSLILWILQGSSNDQDEKNYNNAFEMMPTFGMLHKASAGFMGANFRKMSSQDSQENENQGQDNKAMDSIAENWFQCAFMQFYVGKSIYIIEFFIELGKYLVSK